MALKRMGIVDNYEVNHIYSCKFNLDTCVSKMFMYLEYFIYFITKKSPLYNENRVYKT